MRIAIYSKYLKIVLLLIIVVLLGLAIYLVRSHGQHGHILDAQRAYNDVTYQLDLGPRIMGSTAHEEAARWIVANLKESGWQVEIQETLIASQSVKNIIAKRGSGAPWVVIASHYDSRAIADQDPNPELHNQPVPGANDGASTVAILLELARVIPTNLNKQVWLVFFDDEDNGNSSEVGWSIGSKYFVSQLHGKPDSVVILDMLGDRNLDIYMEKNSNPELNNQIWAIAKELGYSQFIPSYKYAIIDDHLPFIEAGIPAVDVIDFDYLYWHTTQDTLDKISGESLKAAGDTILAWLEH
jgi:glutaminyl-peptide cyclotransferase